MTNDKQVKELTAKERADEIRKTRELHRPLDGRVYRFPALPERPGFKCYWFNDENGAIEAALSKGWEFSKRAGFSDKKLNLKDKPNDRISIRVGTDESGAEIFAYAMDIPMEIYLEDRTRKTEGYRKRIEFIESGGVEQDSTLNSAGANPTVSANMHTTFNKTFKPD